MNILVDDSAAFNQGAGIGRYARNILPAALRLLPGSRVQLLYAPSGKGIPPFYDETVAAFPESVNLTIRRLPFGRRRADQVWFRARLPLPAQVFAGRVDIAYSPDFTLPPTPKTPRAITIHDLAYEICPRVAPPALRQYLSSVVPRQVHGATQVIAVSETTKRDLVERYGIDAAIVEIVPNGVDDRFFSAQPLARQERETIGIPKNYLLMVGTIEPRKNHLNVFAALSALDGTIDLPLVVAGRAGWDEAPILEAARPLIAEGRVILLGYVPEPLLPGLYAGASAIVYPSWYEGFGLPVAEGLATGVPVVASLTPALLETGGTVTLYADPARPDEIAARIADSLASSQHTPEARHARRSWARTYTWQAAGARLAAVFQRMADQN